MFEWAVSEELPEEDRVGRARRVKNISAFLCVLCFLCVSALKEARRPERLVSPKKARPPQRLVSPKKARPPQRLVSPKKARPPQRLVSPIKSPTKRELKYPQVFPKIEERQADVESWTETNSRNGPLYGPCLDHGDRLPYTMPLLVRHGALRRGLVATLAATLGVCASRLSGQTLRVVSETAVDANTGSLPISEPHMAVDPRNPNHLLIGVMVNGIPTSPTVDHGCATFMSTDGGEHWTRHDFANKNCYDPWVVFLPDGSALFSTLGVDPILAGQDEGLLVYRSPDGGRTWAKRPAGLSWGWDHPMLVVDTTQSKKRGWVYLVEPGLAYWIGILRRGLALARR